MKSLESEKHKRWLNCKLNDEILFIHSFMIEKIAWMLLSMCVQLDDWMVNKMILHPSKLFYLFSLALSSFFSYHYKIILVSVSWFFTG